MALAIETSVDDITIESDLLGTVTLPATERWEFPAGLYGFEECTSFALLPAGRDGTFWLQSTTHRALAFLLVDPFVFFPGYEVDFSTADLARIGTAEPTDIVVLAIVTLPAKSSEPWTANLQGPVVLNARARQGFQCIIAKDRFGTRAEFRLNGG
jgi:flagellar assembly factor FliW